MSKKNRRPNSFESGPTFSRALALHQAGRFSEAEAMYLQLPSEDANTLQLLGVLYFQTGRTAEGKSNLTRAIELDPTHTDALTNLGVALHEEGQFLQALSLIERALKIQPNRPDLLDKRGFILQDLNRHEEAARSLEFAVQIEPTFSDAWFHLGNSYLALMRPGDAEKSFTRVLSLRPRDDEALINLGVSLYQQAKPADAVRLLRQAIAIRPSADAYRNLATSLAGLGERDAALNAAKTATDLAPKNAAAHFQFAQLLQSYLLTPDALKCFSRAVELAPEEEEFRRRYAIALNQNGETERSLAEFDQIVEPSGATQFARSLFVPIIPQSRSDIEEGRDRVLTRLGALSTRTATIDDANKEVGLTNFYWSYHSESELPLQRAAVEAYRNCSPDLFWKSPYLDERRSGKLKVGVVCSKLNQHTIGKLFLNLVAGLRDDDIEVTVFDCGTKTDEWTQRLNQQVDASFKLVPDVRSTREFIAEKRMDAIFYPEIGMDPTTYYTAFARLAPLQFMTWGHPSSPALPHIDCFLSSEDLEREGSDLDYAERLIKFKSLMTVFDRPTPPPCTREELGLPPDRTIYACPQSLFKVHPDMDAAFGEILRQDPNSLLVFLTGNEKHWDDLLLQRFTKSIPDVADRIVIHRRLNWREYIGLCDVADAVLDTFYFGGGNSSLEAFAVGAPIVTLPGSMLKGRITLAQYRAMQIDDIIAADTEEFVRLSIRLANDKDWHQSLKQLILERNSVLYGNRKPIHELREFLRSECSPNR